MKFHKILFIFVSIFLVLLFLEFISYMGLKIFHLMPDSSYSNYHDVYQEYYHVSESIERKPHPFFGFSFDPSKKGYYEFKLPESFPNFSNPGQRASSKYFIGLFGGSVAYQLGLYLDNSGEKFKQKIKEQLHLNRDVEFINFSLPSGKEPQQFFIYSYFLEHIDAAIFLDGFNEGITDNYPDHPLEYPYFSFLLFPMTDYFLAGGVGLSSSFHLAQNIYASLGLSAPLLHRSSTFYLGWAILKKVSDKVRFRENKKILEGSKENKGIIYPANTPDAEGRLPYLVYIWKSYVEKAWNLSKGSGKKIYFFIQPNLWFPNSKNFSDEEKKILAGSVDNSYKIKVPIFYPMLIKEQSELNKKGLPVYDLSNVFKNISETLYFDACCHVITKGNELMMENIVKYIH